jgi:glycerol-3-phosphate acyltransferase PlsY
MEASWGLSDLAIAMAGAAAFVGHLAPVFLGFKGGKGVATFLGVILALDWQAGLLVCGVWLLVALASRYSSLASIVSAASAPLLLILVSTPVEFALGAACMAGLLIWRHRPNIRQLATGEERKISLGKRPPQDPSAPSKAGGKDLNAAGGDNRP